MKKIYLIFTFSLFTIISLNAQDIIYTISGEIDNQKTTLDSISIENLTNQSSTGFGELPGRDDYRINLSQNKFWGSTSVHDLAYDNSIYMLGNKPGLISVGYSGHTSTNATITLYNINGQKLLAKNNLTLDKGSLIEVEINHVGIYLLCINIPHETKIFKAIGANKSGQLSIALQNNSGVTLKSEQLYNVNDYTQTGDNIKIQVFKNNYVSTPIEITVEKDTSLVFALYSSTDPIIQTLNASNILSNSVTLNGNILDDKTTIIIRGFYWSHTNDTPDSDDNVAIASGTTGNYSKNIIGLQENTTYYYRAFVTNSESTSTGKVVSFKTEDSPYGLFTDSRDDQTYRTVKIGTQTWIAENMVYLPSVSPSSSESYTKPCYYVYDYQGTSVNDAKATDNYKTYGVLYNWPAAINACPSGWHLPTDEEWKQLEMYTGMSQSDADTIYWRGTNEGKKLKAISGWNNNGNGTDEYGFGALPAGGRGTFGKFNAVGYNSTWWSSTKDNSSYAWFRGLDYSDSEVYRLDDSQKLGFSVRCVKD